MDWVMAGVFSTVVIAVVGGASAWIRWVISGAVKDNDARHQAHTERTHALGNKLQTLEVKVAATSLTREEFERKTQEQTRAIETMFTRVHQRLDDVVRGSYDRA